MLLIFGKGEKRGGYCTSTYRVDKYLPQYDMKIIENSTFFRCPRSKFEPAVHSKKTEPAV